MSAGCRTASNRRRSRRVHPVAARASPRRAQRHAPESRVKSIEARIDGLTCPTCVPPLRASLKRQYGKSAIDVDDDKDTATIRFAEKEHFSATDFRAAVERVRMRVVTVRMQACGTVETSDGNKWLTAGGSRFLVRSDASCRSTSRSAPTARSTARTTRRRSRSRPSRCRAHRDH